MIETLKAPTETPAPNSLLREIATLIVEAVNLHHIDPATLTENTSLREGGLELDSIDMLEVIVGVEQRYGIKVADAETGKKYFRTLGGIVEFVSAPAEATSSA
jgi:acyl carrier protein